MKKIRYFVVMVLIFLLLSGCGSNVKSVATVNGEAISQAIFDKNLEKLNKANADNGTKWEGKDGQSKLAALKKQVLEMLIQKQLEIQEAKKRNVVPKENEIEKKASEIKKAYGANYEQMLKGQGMSEQEFKEAIKYQLTREALFKDINKNIKVSAAELEKYYQDNKKDMVAVKARQILVSFQNRSPEESKSIAEDIIKQLAQGKDFATLAQEKSDDPGSKKNGGLMVNPMNPQNSFIRKNQLFGELATALFALKSGEFTTTPIKTGNGYLILKIEESKNLTLDEVKNDLEKQLSNNKQATEYNKVISDLKKKAKIKSEMLDKKK